MYKSAVVAMRSFGVVVCVALVAAACSSGADSPTPTLALESTTTVTKPVATTAAPTTTEAPTTTLSPEQVAEVELRELVMAYLTIENNEFEEGRIEPWPKLALTTGRLLDRLSSIRAEDLELDHYLIGTYENPVVTSVEVDTDRSTARVYFCTDDASRLVDADGVELIGRGERRSTVGYLLSVNDGDGWLLEELIFKEDQCDQADYVD